MTKYMTYEEAYKILSEVSGRTIKKQEYANEEDLHANYDVVMSELLQKSNPQAYKKLVKIRNKFCFWYS